MNDINPFGLLVGGAISGVVAGFAQAHWNLVVGMEVGIAAIIGYALYTTVYLLAVVSR